MSNKRPRSSKKDDLVSQFCAVTGASETVGERLLEACNNDLQMAIGIQLDGADLGGGGGDAPYNNPAGEMAATATATAMAAGTATAIPAAEPGDDVRAPIPQRSEVLVSDAPNIGWRSRRRAANSVFDAFRDFQAEARQQEEQQQAGPSTSVAALSKRRTLEDLFRPPIDLMHKGSFQSAKEYGTSKNKWLLVNVQNVKEFACQMLNRDVWSNQTVKNTIKNEFIFWQVYHDSEEGRKYTQFYKVTEWPYIAILDPITGENLATWTKLDPKSLCDLLAEFLFEHPTPDGSPSGPPSKRAKRNSIVDASEDSQMEAAIQASLTETTFPQDALLDLDSDSLEGCTDEDEVDSSDNLETFSDSDDSASQDSPAPSPKKRAAKKSSSRGIDKSSAVSKTPAVKAQACAQSHEQSAGEENHTCAKAPVENGAGASKTSGAKEESTSKNTWRHFLGDDEDAKSNILLRFPDGKRQQFQVPHSSKLQALVLYTADHGYPSDRYELLTNFPKRNLLSLDRDITLKDAGLFPQETVFVHER